ncbi:restriction endonuclease subunit S [Vibrio cholerae]|uniref:restriction endonuclease subunit S n=1 Tax=Vibrio cholerae TaxID=666 RepID=UPI000892F612|nr:restriction endonuclease subunit S [Vibrio cholerae]OFI76152.1 restriction endonuclease subunit S [Vibrio cholerae]OFI76752.1 restriction endonuclease subunit S [Vibrio cholerae]
MSEVEATLIPKSWIILPLSEVIQMQKGKKPHDLGGKSNLRTVPYINIKAFEKGIVTEYAPEQDAIYCTEKDVLLVWDGARAGLSGRGVNGYVGSTLVKVTSDIAEMNYLSYYFESIYSILNTQTKGVGIPHINPVVLNNLPFNLAPENEQTRIVDKLEELFSELDAGVKELKAAQTKLSQYRQSLLKSAVEGSLTQQWRAENRDRVQETGEQLLARILKQRREQWQQQKLAEFAEKDKTPPKNWQDAYPEPVQPDTTDLPKLPEGWVWASLDMIISKVEAGKSFKCLERPPELGEYGVVKVSAVTWGEYNEQESKTCTRSDLENDTILIKEEDFLFSRANTTELVGACVIAKHVTKKVMLSDKILRLQFVENKLKYWLLQFMRGELGRTQIEYAASGNQASMKNVAQGKLLKFAVPLPPLAEVEEIQSNLTSAFQYIVNSASEAEITLKFLHAQRKNILKSAFSGQLVPQDPTDEPASVLLEKIKLERDALAKMPKPRKPNKPKKNGGLMNTLLEVLTAENNWIDAQDAFQKCGIVNGTSTDRIEEIYTELRKLEKAGKIEIQRQGDFDRLKLIKQDVKED